MRHTRGAPYHPQTQGKIERWHQTLKNRILLENYYLPGDLEVCSAVCSPVNVAMATHRTTFSTDELANAGVKRISVGSALALLVYGSLIAAAQDIAQSDTFDFLENVMYFADLNAFFKPPTGQ
jgi:transposase InsO family protein